MQELIWWKRAVVYQIYPRSFQDSNGDGIGDLNGIRSRLDYLVRLCIDAVWISPIYPSPMADFGYDVADYCGIDPIFGNLADFDCLLAEAHASGLKIILDFVPNHTSDQHPWFLESRSSRDNPKRDWYLWRDRPNNWLSNFGGAAWEFDQTTGQYYMHSFLKEQPDLNWRNPAVRQAMYDALRFWLRRGVDGFRVDVMWLMSKDDHFRDNPPNPCYRPGEPESSRSLSVYNTNRPEVHEIVAQMRAVVDEFPERVLIGEVYLPIRELMTYYGIHLEGANLPFNFQLLQSDWNASAIARAISDYESALPTGAWPNWVLGNHDQPRLASRVGPNQARVAAMLLLTLPGTLTVYNGEELGMTNVPIPLNSVQDPAEKNQPGIGAGRDPERTPIPWDASPQAGFTTGLPWLPIGSDYTSLNVAALEENPNSILQLYKSLIQLRRDHPALASDKVSSVAAEGTLLRYQRPANANNFQVLLNMGQNPTQAFVKPGAILLSTYLDRHGESIGKFVYLRASEGLILLS